MLVAAGSPLTAGLADPWAGGAGEFAAGRWRRESSLVRSRERSRRLVLVVCGALALAGGVAAIEPVGASGPASGPSARLHTVRGLSPLPAAARAPISAAVGADERGYWVRGLRASDRAQRLAFTFSPTGVRIASRAGWVRLSLTAVGRGGTLTRVRPVTPTAHLNRVTYDRGTVHEWYANGPVGLEQGFELPRAPAGAGPIVLSLALRGDLRARMDDGTMRFGGARGLRYGDLAVTDATGRRLPASLGLAGSQLRISIDASGARYPLHVDPVLRSAEPETGETQTAELTTSYGVNSVAVSGDTIAVGVPGYDPSGDAEGYGAVLVFEQHGGVWDTTPDATLTASDENAGSQLGFSVAISDDTIVAGAIGHASSPAEGSVYVFTEPSSGWTSTTQTAELNANVGEAGDNVGESVGISGNTVVAGAPYLGSTTPGGQGGDGGAFVWVEPSTGWTNMHTQTAELAASDATYGEEFGWSVAISGDEVAVGAPDYATASTTRQGAAYVFDEPAGGWANMTDTAELTASDGASYDELGESVAISGNTLAAGAPNHTNVNTDDYTHQGAIYELSLPATGSVEEAAGVTVTSTSEYQDGFGESVALAGGSLLGTQPSFGTDGYQAVYEFPGATELVPSDAVANDYFLGSVAVDGSTAVIGAYSEFGGTPPGNAYVYPSGGSASAPTVTTDAATAVTSTTASLAATINAGSTDTNYVFDYGTSSSALGSALPAAGQFGAGTGATAIAQHAQEVTGLTSGTTYYYEACATNVATGSTPACGSVQSFTTLGSSPTPTPSPGPSPSPSPSPSPTSPKASVGKASVSGDTASVPVSCTGSGTCSVTVSLSVTETLSGGKVTAVAASASKKKPRHRKKTVTVGQETIKLAAGTHETVKVSLNRTGKQLLAKHPTLKVKLLVSESGKTLKTTTITFKAKKPKHKKKAKHGK